MRHFGLGVCLRQIGVGDTALSIHQRLLEEVGDQVIRDTLRHQAATCDAAAEPTRRRVAWFSATLAWRSMWSRGLWPRGLRGTEGFTAPEVEAGMGFDFKADVYSVAATTCIHVVPHRSAVIVHRRANGHRSNQRPMAADALARCNAIREKKSIPIIATILNCGCHVVKKSAVPTASCSRTT